MKPTDASGSKPPNGTTKDTQSANKNSSLRPPLWPQTKRAHDATRSTGDASGSSTHLQTRLHNNNGIIDTHKLKSDRYDEYGDDDFDAAETDSLAWAPASATASARASLQLELDALAGAPLASDIDSETDAMLSDQQHLHHNQSPGFRFETTTHAFPLSTTLSKSDIELERSVSLWSGIALIVGVSIGSGIFASPGPVFEYSGSVGAALLAWICAGLLAIAGGLCYAELGTMMPASGGEHPYLMRGFGQLPAFLFSWTSITVTRPGSLAIITVICAEYVCRIIYYEHPSGVSPKWLVKSIAAIIIIGLSGINAVSSRASTMIQDVFTILKLVSLAFISVVGVVVLFRDGPSRSHNFDRPLFEGTSTNPGDHALALFSALWAYDGWNNLNMVTGELKNPSKNLPRAVIFGPLIVIICYVATNVAYFAVLPANVVGLSTTIGMDFGRAVFGRIGGIVIPLIVVGSTCGAANATLFTGSRVVFISAQKGHAPSFLAKIHPKTRTPLNAVMLQAVCSIVFIIVGNFKSLVNFYSMIAWSFYLLAILALLTLRLSDPYEDRPFAVWLPVPILFCGVTVCLMTFSVWEAPWEAFGAAVFAATGMIVYGIGNWLDIRSEDFFTFCIMAGAALLAWIPIPSFKRCLQRREYERHQDLHEMEMM